VDLEKVSVAHHEVGDFTVPGLLFKEADLKSPVVEVVARVVVTE
jgi:hypothetical protein